MFTHTITISEKGILYGEWENEADFRSALPPIRTWKESSPDDTLGLLNEAFQSSVPSDLLLSLAEQYAIVRVLIEAEQYELARHIINKVDVSPELEDAKASLIAIIPLAAP